MEDKEKLKVVIEHWIEHNKEHAEEFREWAGKAKGFGENATGENITRAAEQLEAANESLLTASKALTGEKS